VCKELGPEFGVFGVCMGHQCIGQVFGGDIVRAPCGLMHGKSSPVWHTEGDTILRGLTSPFQAGPAHSPPHCLLMMHRYNSPPPPRWPAHSPPHCLLIVHQYTLAASSSLACPLAPSLFAHGAPGLGGECGRCVRVHW